MDRAGNRHDGPGSGREDDHGIPTKPIPKKVPPDGDPPTGGRDEKKGIETKLVKHKRRSEDPERD